MAKCKITKIMVNNTFLDKKWGMFYQFFFYLANYPRTVTIFCSFWSWQLRNSAMSYRKACFLFFVQSVCTFSYLSPWISSTSLYIVIYIYQCMRGRTNMTCCNLCAAGNTGDISMQCENTETQKSVDNCVKHSVVHSNPSTTTSFPAKTAADTSMCLQYINCRGFNHVTSITLLLVISLKQWLLVHKCVGFIVCLNSALR